MIDYPVDRNFPDARPGGSDQSADPQKTALGVAVIGGLALSTPVTLFLVPVLLVAVRGEGWRQRRLGS